MEEQEKRFLEHQNALCTTISHATQKLMDNLAEANARREARLSKSFAKNAVQSAEIGQLQAQNATLHDHQLATKFAGVSNAHDGSRTASMMNSGCQTTTDTRLGTVSYEEYAELAQKYEKTRAENNKLIESLNIMIARHNSDKKNIKAWAIYIEEFKAKRKREKAAAKGSLADAEMPRRQSSNLAPNAADYGTENQLRMSTSSISPAPPLSPMNPMVDLDAGGRLHTYESLPVSKDSEPARILPQDAILPTRQEDESVNEQASLLPEDTSQPASGNPDTTKVVPNESQKIVSSQATADEDPSGDQENMSRPVSAHDGANEDDLPIVLSSRSVKNPSRRPLRNGQQAANRRAMTTSSIKIKNEPTSSPIEFEGAVVLHRTTTVDLDEFGHLTKTPRKRRQPEEIFRNAKRQSTGNDSEDEVQNEKPGSSFIGKERNTASTVNVQGRNSFIKQENDNTEAFVCSQQAVKIEKLASGSTSASRDQHTRREPVSKAPNARLLPHTGTREGTPRRGQDPSRGAVAIPEVAEDGEFQGHGLKPTLLSKKVESDRRLMNLLHTDIASIKGMSLDVLTPVRDRERMIAKNTPQGSLSFPAGSVPASPQPASAKSFAAASSTPTTTGQQRNTHVHSESRSTGLGLKLAHDAQSLVLSRAPLRARSLSHLSREDFVVNPQYNQGLDYAFQETVRKVAERRCLPGCTRSECCGGHFRNLVEIGGLKPTIERGLWDPLMPLGSSEEREEEERVLKWFLGGLYERSKTERMNSSERKETLVQARAKLLADRAGKHRQSYERRKTPPLYWETDMPSTQEFAEARQKADEEERKEVEKRWLDAMRKGGYWKFRDE